MRHFSLLERDDMFGNFCWPTIIRLKDGRLLMACSGLRMEHIDPFGKVVACLSEDEGQTWSEPYVLINTPLDDRDAGLMPYGDGFLLTSFNNKRELQRSILLPNSKHFPNTEEKRRIFEARVNEITDEEEKEHYGSLLSYFDANLKEQYRIHLPITSPHGPTLLQDGRVMYVGRIFDENLEVCHHHDGIVVMFSDDAKNFGDSVAIDLPIEELPKKPLFCEPHGLQLADGTILIHIRLQGHDVDNKHFTVYQSVSTDGGKTFRKAEPLCVPDGPMYGSPSHLMQMEDGTVVMSYSYRFDLFGQRARISRDSGKTWSKEVILRDDGLSWDLGYPATVELKNGNLLTVYYQIPVEKENRAILGTEWNLKEFGL